MQSEMPLSAWRGSFSVFNHQHRTGPAYMVESATASDVAAFVSPPEPFVTIKKERAPYFVPCTLREAPLVAKTLERANAAGLPLIGIQRSSSHVTEGSWLKLDLDSIGRNEVNDLISRLEDEKIGYIIYSTHGQGLKPRNRLRLILFLDRALPPPEYKRACQGASLWLLGESLDPTEAALHQQAGVFMSHPERLNKAFRFVRIGGHA